MTNCKELAIVYSKPNCPMCVEAKTLLKNKNICFEEKTLGTEVSIETMLAHVGHPVRSVPQIFLNSEYVGGLAELRSRI